MKKTSKIIITSVLTIVACVSLIAGATFALFSSESSTNVAITSATVDVKASIDESSLQYSYDPSLQGPNTSFDYKVTDGNLVLNYLAPGDELSFDIQLSNESTIPVKWQLSVAEGDEDQAGFFRLLSVETEGYDMVATSKASLTAWQSVAAGSAIDPLHVSIGMPVEVTQAQVDEYSETQKLVVTVTAIQGNAATTDPVASAINLHESFDVDELKKGEITQNVNLLNDIELPKGDGWEALNISDTAVFNGNGYTISFTQGDPETFAETEAEVRNVTLRLATDFGKRCTWDEQGDTEVAWQANNANGLKAFAQEVNTGIAAHTIARHAPRSLRAPVVAHTRNFEGELVELTGDIDLLGVTDWQPIGSTDSMPSKLFKGTFDGKGHTISNLTYTTQQSGAGLFNSTAEAKFENIVLKNITVSGTEYVGALVGYGYTSDYENVTALNVKLTGNHFVGGIAGGSYSQFVNCHVEKLEIVCTPDGQEGSYDNGDKVGGLIGIEESGSFRFENCSVKDANITAFRDVGGFTGYANIGRIVNSKVENVHITIDRQRNYSEEDPKPFNADSYIGRKAEGCNVDEASASAVSNFTVSYVNCGEFFKTDDGKYRIESASGLGEFRDSVNGGENYAGVTVQLMSDVDLQNEDWTPIGEGYDANKPFKGTFDGNGYTISNLTVNSTNRGFGLFARCDGATIRNLAIGGLVQISANDSYGAVICGYGSGTFEDIVIDADPDSYVKSTLTGLDVGSIVGLSNGSTVTDVESNITVSATGGRVGGIIGQSNGDALTRVTYKGYVDASSNRGGIVGMLQSGTTTVTDCHFVGKLKALLGGAETTYEQGIWGGKVSGSATVKNSDCLIETGDGFTDTAVWDDGGKVTHGYTVADLAGLKAFANIVSEGKSFRNVTVSLLDDVDLGGEEWTPIGATVNGFDGWFDGNGHKITGLSVTQLTRASQGSYYAGLFGYVSRGKITNLKVYGEIRIDELPQDAEHNYLGGIAGISRVNNSLYSDVDISVSAGSRPTAELYVGGITGQLLGATGAPQGSNSDLLNGGDIRVEGTVKSAHIGGIAGLAQNGSGFNFVNLGKLSCAVEIASDPATQDMAFMMKCIGLIIGLDVIDELGNCYSVASEDYEACGYCSRTMMEQPEHTATLINGSSHTREQFSGFDFGDIWDITNGKIALR